MSDKKKKNRESREETIQKLKELKEAAEKKAAEEKAAEEKKEEEKAADTEKAPESETKEEAAEAPAEGEAAAEGTEEAEPESAKLAEMKDRLMRQMAEFENFRRRTEKEKQTMFETGAKSVIEKLLPVVDNFERGLGALKEEEKGAFSDGMEMIYKQLMGELEKLEVKPIDAVGKEFDPNLHNAVMHVDDEELGENVVAEELQKGYMYRETVVRHSMVKVAN